MWYLNVQLRKIMIPYSNMIGWVRTDLFVIGISSKVWLNHKCHCFLYKMRNENLPFIVTLSGNYLIFDQQWSTSLSIWTNYLTFEMKSLTCPVHDIWQLRLWNTEQKDTQINRHTDPPKIIASPEIFISWGHETLIKMCYLSLCVTPTDR